MPTLAKIIAVDHEQGRVAVSNQFSFTMDRVKLFNLAGTHINTPTITEISARDADSQWLTLDVLSRKAREGFQLLQ